MDTAAFTGRASELSGLVAVAAAPPVSGFATTVVISAINGMAGVGKTALAVRVAHQVKAQFPDGQLYVDLHGYTRGISPLEPAAALAAFLRALGLAPRQIPSDLDSLTALYRSRLAGTRTLVLLDNAIDEAQVRPLIPGDGHCLVLVTSRKRLKALDDAYPVPLDVLPRSDAAALFRRVAGIDQALADTRVEEIVELCGRLPLALRTAAAVIRNHPAWDLRRLAIRLGEDKPTLSGFRDGDRDLAAVFQLSYQTLNGGQQRLLRHLGLVQGPDIDPHAAAALLECGTGAAEHLLIDLVEHSLLVESPLGRYRMHDLVRLYARLVVRELPADQQDAGQERLLEYYQRTATRAQSRLTRGSAESADAAPAFVDAASARVWLRAERANLLASIEHVSRHGHEERVVALSAGMANLLRTDGPWPLALTVSNAAARAAEHLGDRRGQAHSLTASGAVRRLLGDVPGAVHDLQRALSLYEQVEDSSGQAAALTYLGAVRRLTRNLDEALQDLERATQLHAQLGERAGMAHALLELGSVRILTGDVPGGMRDYERCQEIYQQVGEENGQATALSYIGGTFRIIGDYPQAVSYLQRALDLFQKIGERNGEGISRTELGDTYRLLGDLPRATSHLQEALALFHQVDARGNIAWTLNRYAAAVAASDDHSQAMELYTEALHLAKEVNLPDEQARALEGIGECQIRAGDSHTGATHLQQALTIFRQLAMPDAERIEARLARLGEPQ